MKWRYLVWGATHEAEPRTFSELEIALEKIWDIFSAGPINKAVSSFRNR